MPESVVITDSDDRDFLLPSGFMTCPLNSLRWRPRVCSTTDSCPHRWQIPRLATPTRPPHHAPHPTPRSPSPLPDRLSWLLDDMTENEHDKTIYPHFCHTPPTPMMS